MASGGSYRMIFVVSINTKARTQNLISGLYCVLMYKSPL